MPLYEYFCSKCNNSFEEQYLIEYRDVPVTQPCRNCKEYAVKRCVGNEGGFRLKGSCWARDNYSTHVGSDPRYQAGDINIGGK